MRPEPDTKLGQCFGAAFFFFAGLVTRFAARTVHFGLTGQPTDQKPGPSLTQNFNKKNSSYLPQLSRIHGYPIFLSKL
jgi:hypothetical protein